jgi:hypothetical protein
MISILIKLHLLLIITSFFTLIINFLIENFTFYLLEIEFKPNFNLIFSLFVFFPRLHFFELGFLRTSFYFFPATILIDIETISFFFFNQ